MLGQMPFITRNCSLWIRMTMGCLLFAHIVQRVTQRMSPLIKVYRAINNATMQ